MIFKENIIEIADNYDYFILDVWGVIHDGIATYPFVVDRIKALRKLNKKICFLSNAPRRQKRVATVLENYGITSDLYDFILTSGEASYLHLEKNQNNNFSELKENYYYIGPQKDIDLLDGLNYNMVDKASQANFVVATGFDHEFSVLEEKLPQLEEAAKYNLPMICVNPDLRVIRHSGHESICAGVLASEYKKMGGEVIYFGKPYELVYKKVFELFGTNDNKRILAVGDGMETDILGASNNKVDSALIGGGILSNVLKIKYGQLPDRNNMEKICEQYQSYPKFVIAGL